MVNTLITAGEFAKLARTTKRTILWYDQIGVLKPELINEEGYRFYKPEQLIDFQIILLLRSLNFSLEQIQAYLAKNNTLRTLFKSKESDVEKQIKVLQKTLSDINNYSQNL